MEYGSRIPDVAYEIQTRVKKSVENMTGLKVSEVNVHVQGVKTEKEVEEKEENEEVIEEQKINTIGNWECHMRIVNGNFQRRQLPKKKNGQKKDILGRLDCGLMICI